MRIIVAEAGTEYRIASEHPVRTPADVGRESAEIAASETECMAVISLNAKNGMLACEIITAGLVDSSLVHPREVFRTAILRNAKSIVLVHNHPTGDTTPSAEDVRITRQIVEAGRIVGIDVLDHVIVGRGAAGGVVTLSMRESGLVQFGI